MIRDTNIRISLVLKGNSLFFIRIIINVVILTFVSTSTAYNFEKQCRTTTNCNPTNHTNFICWDGICVCDVSRQLVYDNSKNYCLRPPGAKCESQEDCVQNAFCDHTTELCVCSEHFEETINSECKGKYKSRCNDTILCDETKFLQCIDDKCTCASGHNMYFERKSDKCVVELGHQCELTAWMGMQMECESNALCVTNKERQDEFYGVCQCKENLVANFGICERAIGSPCSETNESSCQDGINLECHQGQCRCVDDAVYDSFYNQCRLKIGITCHPTLDNQCVSNATCTYSEEEAEMEIFRYAHSKGKCKCSNGYRKTSRGSCKADYHNFCHEDSDCYTEGSLLSCLTAVCSCKMGQVYDKEKQSCVSLVDNPCTFQLSHPHEQQLNCVQNAVCIRDEDASINSGRGRCMCKQPFIHLIESCVPGIGTPCNTSLSCTEELGLTCSTEKICVCGDTMIFDSTTNTCKIKSGGYCQQNGLLQCTDNSNCTASYEEYREKCICDSKFNSAPDGSCLLGYGELCNEFSTKGAICNEHRTFKCINSTCGCEPPLIYNERLNYCEIVAVTSQHLSSSVHRIFYPFPLILSNTLANIYIHFTYFY